MPSERISLRSSTKAKLAANAEKRSANARKREETKLQHNLNMQRAADLAATMSHMHINVAPNSNSNRNTVMHYNVTPRSRTGVPFGTPIFSGSPLGVSLLAPPESIYAGSLSVFNAIPVAPNKKVKGKSKSRKTHKKSRSHN